jgi:hypothetical protein
MRFLQKESLSLKLKNVAHEAKKRFRRLGLSKNSEIAYMTVSGRAASGFDPVLAP